MPGKRELKTEKSTKKLWLIPSCAAAAVVGVYAGFCVAAGASDAIVPHTVVGGTDVGGLTRTEAAQVLKPALGRLRAESGVHVTLESGEEVAYLSYDELGVTFDADTLAQGAYENGRSGNAFADGWDLLTAAFGKSSAVTPEPADGWTEAAAEKLADASELDAQDFAYAIEGEKTLLLTKARDGRDVDRPTLRARLDEAEADESGSRTVLLPYAVDAADPGNLKALNETLGGEMANARYDAETDTILPERPALNFDLAQAQMLLDAAAPGVTVSVDATASTPEVTAEQLKEVLFRDVLGTYTTRVSGATGRKENVKLTAERVNGTVLNSGDEFDYYSLTGPFTAANGYKPAPGYLNGKTVDMDGGGACQCSSTTYAAALYANLEIVARTAHGFASSYIGLGLDATVSGGGPEFRFRNNTAYPIKIEAIYSNNRLTINLLGTKVDDITVNIRSETLSVTPYEDEYLESPDLAPGETKVEQTPYTGYFVKTYRQLYDGEGNLISETLEATSRYRARNRITLVAPGELPGTQQPADMPAPADPPATDPVGAPTDTPTDAPADPPATETPAPTDLPGGVDPTPIDEQIEQLAPAESGKADGTGA